MKNHCYQSKHTLFIVLLLLHISAFAQPKKQPNNSTDTTNPERLFLHPPESAKPGVLWMWMGCNLSESGITKDLEALKKEGFNRTTMFSLADITTPWANEIRKSPTPDIISWTEPWWKLVRHAAEESKRLGMDFGMFNGPSYESSGGVWITPELSMQEICWSQTPVKGGAQINIQLNKPQVDPHANEYFPVYNPVTKLVEKPEIEARKTYYKDIAVLALPATGIVSKDSIINLTDKMQPDGKITQNLPPGDWIIYRFGHTTMGALIQPAQWKATGLECDKMSQEAVDFHMDHVIGEIQKHLGDLIGTGFTHVHFDSYEAGNPTWTPKMKEEFLQRRGYDLTPYLASFAGRTIGSVQDSAKFANDFDATIKDLYRDVYFTTISKKLKKANLAFLCEPYGGPWRQDDVMPLVSNVMTEFWTNEGVYSPYELDPTVAALRKSGQNIIEAEAFTGDPKYSHWNETPAWLKPIGDAAFCAGVNRMVLHRFVEQPWDDKYKPGATMGQWGTHFDRTQTWWKPAAAMVAYWQRCQAILQWGHIAKAYSTDFAANDVTDSITIRFTHRNSGNANIYFVTNTSRRKGNANCTFHISGMQPELWDPVSKNMRTLTMYEDKNGSITVPMNFDEAQSFFIVFRKKLLPQLSVAKNNFPAEKDIYTINKPWLVQFDTAWGGPQKPVPFSALQDWTKNDNDGIKYFSGTAVYTTSFNLPEAQTNTGSSSLFLSLGEVKNIARVTLNNKDLGVVWTAPWQIKIPQEVLKHSNNILVIEVTNTWTNRLIGDEQQPDDCTWLPGEFGGHFLAEFPDWFLQNKQRPSKGRYCFTTWNYFTKDSPLLSSGLLGPVKILKEE